MSKCPGCVICGNPDTKLFYFKDFEPQPFGFCGKARGCEWLCEKHRLQARDVGHLNSIRALDFLRKNFDAGEVDKKN